MCQYEEMSPVMYVSHIAQPHLEIVKDIFGEFSGGHPDEVHHEQQQQPEDDPLRPRQDLGARRGRHPRPQSLIPEVAEKLLQKSGSVLLLLRKFC